MASMLPRLFGENMMDVFDPFSGEDFFVNESKRDPLFGRHASRLMRTDIHEAPDAYLLEIDLPGFAKEDIFAELKDGYLTVSAKKTLNEDEENQKGRVLRQERYSGSCQRSFYVGEGVKESDCEARYENGILTIRIPKAQPQQPQRQAISIA